MTVIGDASDMPRTHCQVCGHLFDEASGIGTNHRPRPGNVALCIMCSNPMIFKNDLTLREPTFAERLEIENDPEIKMVREAQRRIKN